LKTNGGDYTPLPDPDQPSAMLTFDPTDVPEIEL
jgi:hypothetical protein